MAGNWQTTLDAVERSIADCLDSLARYEAAFTEALSQQGVERPAPPAETRWDQVLSEAGQTLDGVERLLAEQEGLWQHWRATVAEWHRLIQQSPWPAGNCTTPSANGIG